MPSTILGTGGATVGKLGEFIFLLNKRTLKVTTLNMREPRFQGEVLADPFGAGIQSWVLAL